MMETPPFLAFLSGVVFALVLFGLAIIAYVVIEDGFCARRRKRIAARLERIQRYRETKSRQIEAGR